MQKNGNENLQNDPNTPWKKISPKSAQRSGNCVMRSVEGVEEVILLDRLNEINQNGNSTIASNNILKLDTEKRINTMTLKCYEIASRLFTLAQYFYMIKDGEIEKI
ncbi:MAG: hypothetical protein LBI69_01755 [Puniceicoccales bacterium]|jgi:hypothetical protein|nr:hypothetical protein [Puniceicoccales bacterium]